MAIENKNELEMEQAQKDMPDFVKMMDVLELVRGAIKDKREIKRSQTRQADAQLTEDEQRKVIEDVLINYVPDNPFTNESEHGDKISKEAMSKSLNGFVKHCQQVDPVTEMSPQFYIGEYQRYAKIQAKEDAQKNDSKKKDEIKKTDSAEEIAKKVENAEDSFKKSPEYYETIIAILENTLEGARSATPNPSMYYWATQQLIESKELTVQFVETDTEQQIKFAVDFPGVSKEFKTVCFKKQKDEIAATTNLRDLSDLDKMAASADGSPIPKTTDEASLRKYDNFAKNPSSQFHDYKRKIFPGLDISQPIIGPQPITNNRDMVAMIVHSLRDTPDLNADKEKTDGQEQQQDLQRTDT